MIRLIASDIDGVLYVNGSLITRTVTFMQRLQGSGVYCTVITGMGVKRIQRKLGSFQANCPVVVDDGGRIVARDGRTAVSHPLSERDIMDIAPLLAKMGISMAAFSCPVDEKYVCLVHDPEGQFIVRNGLGPEDVRETTSDAQLFLELALRYGCTRITVKPKEGCPFDPPPSVRCAKNEDKFNITSRGVDKGTALVELCGLLNVSLDETLVIGNDFNDIPMFKQLSRHRIAVGECPAELTALGSYHVELPEQVSDILTEIFGEL